MKVRYCTQCGMKKPYDPTAKPNTPASMFKGHSCWSCFKTRVTTLRVDQLVVGATAKEQVYQKHLASLAKLRVD